MMYVPECLWLLLLISGTCFRYWTSTAINLKMTDMNPFITLIGPFLVYKNWDLILPGAQRSEHLGSCRRMWHLIHCVLIYDQFHNQGRESTGTGRDRLPVGVFSPRHGDRVALLTVITCCCISRENIFLGLQLFKMSCAYIHINSHFISWELSGFY